MGTILNFEKRSKIKIKRGRLCSDAFPTFIVTFPNCISRTCARNKLILEYFQYTLLSLFNVSGITK